MSQDSFTAVTSKSWGGRLGSAFTGFASILIAFSLSLITIAAAWLFYRPFVGVPLLIAGIAVLVMVIKNRKKKTPAVAAAGATPA
jgi:hypothetical protein